MSIIVFSLFYKYVATNRYISLSVYTANRVFIVTIALYCVKRYSKKNNWILRF